VQDALMSLLLKFLADKSSFSLLKKGNFAMSESISIARLEARISTELLVMLKRATEIEGCIMLDFVVAAVQDAAHRVIEQSGVIRLSLDDQTCFAAALISPDNSIEALKRAFARRKKLFGVE
jgi:uncharacterized protein (DUF1778 family)